MPKIYSEEKRREITEQLLDEGLALVKQFGIKKLSVEAVTKKVGIAQGTFYSFFPSKEMLIYALAQRYQSKISAHTQALIAEKGGLDREDLRAIYFSMMLGDSDNIFRYLSRADMQVLLTRLPKECFHKIADTKAEIERNLQHARNKKNDCDINAVINWIQVMNLAVQNRDLLIDTGLEKTIRILIENMLDEIFESGDSL